MKKKSILNTIFKILLNTILILNLFKIAYSIPIYLDINEFVDIEYDGTEQYKINVSGNLTIINNATKDNIYEYGLTLNKDLILQSKLEDTDLKYYENNLIKRNIDPKSQLSQTYEFNGYIPEHILRDFVDTKKSFFEWYVTEIYFSPIKIASINKFNRLETHKPKSSRKVSVTGFNPTEFNVKIEQIRLSKTDSSGYYDFKKDENLLNIFTKELVLPNETFEFVTTDEFSDDTTVYWIDYKINTQIQYNAKSEIQIIDKSKSNGKKDKDDEKNETIIDYKQSLKNLKFTKTIDNLKLTQQSEFPIFLQITNANNHSLSNLKITDPIHKEFLYYDRLNKQKKEFTKTIKTIRPFETMALNYYVYFDKSEDELIFVQPATIKYYNETKNSNPITLINNVSQYEKELLVEKTINKNKNGTSTVEIKISNVGNYSIYDFKLIESILKNTSNNQNPEFSEKSWNIPHLKPNQVWTTKYETIYGEESTNVPEIYGIENSKIYKTIIVNSQISSQPIESKSSKLLTALVILGISIFIIDIIVP